MALFPSELVAAASGFITRCRDRGVMIVTAESCTGGLLAALLTEIPGASAVFERGFVTYSNTAKQQLLGVSAELLAAHGAVSAEVAQAMAQGARRAANGDVHLRLSLAITGIAGPGGGSAQKPVGTVFIASDGAVLRCERHHFSGDRGEIRMAALRAGMLMLYENISI